MGEVPIGGSASFGKCHLGKFDLSDFVGKTLNALEPSTSFSCEPHKTKVVRFTRHGVCFPLKKKFEQDNDTLEGLEASTPYQEWGLVPDSSHQPVSGSADDALGNAADADDSAQLAGPEMPVNLDPFLPDELRKAEDESGSAPRGRDPQSSEVLDRQDWSRLSS